ncbi:MAG: type II toxin-antitoxin system VapC family toxin [Caulobacteraceae bacterium]|nr:type II toxin-antitoxin system VapC family toxin [Caulobacteraceae bacterium]
MSVYFDASVIVSLFVASDRFTRRAGDLLASRSDLPVVSDLAVAEFVSAISRLTRVGTIDRSAALHLFDRFDAWRAERTTSAEVSAADIQAADRHMRRLDLNLRTTDAIHIAIAARLGSLLVTFDIRMAESAKALGVEVAPV